MRNSARTVFRDVMTAAKFLIFPHPRISFIERALLLMRFMSISRNVECTHNEYEIIAIADSFLRIPDDVGGVFVEAGAYKGGSSAKLSLVARLAKRKLIIFDSFQGLPDNNDIYLNKDKILFEEKKQDKILVFYKGQYHGSLAEVRKNIKKFGSIESCAFRKGWFESTMPAFTGPIAGIFLDVDLSSSTRTCLKFLYPQLQKHGLLYSHDGHLGKVLEVYEDRDFWRREVKEKKPRIDGLGESKLLMIHKS